MKILVTGANGYLGQGIVRELLNMGHIVVATDKSCVNIDTRAHIYICNLFDIENPFEYFEKPDILLHLSWKDGFNHNSKSHLEELSKHILFIEKMCKSKIKKVVVMGSMHEIGLYDGCIDENTPCNPLSMYGIAKNTLRQVTSLITKEYLVKFQWLRGYYIIGNVNFGSSIFSKIYRAAQNGEKEFPFTTGQNRYDFLSYEKFCNYVAITILQDKVLGIINISSGKSEKIADIVENFIKENNLNIKLKYGVFKERPYDSKEVWGSNKLLNEVIKNATIE